MTLKILGILIPIPLLCFIPEPSRENIQENPPIAVSLRDESSNKTLQLHNNVLPQKTFSKEFIKHLQDIHSFESVFDDSYFGGLSYEEF